MKRGREKSKGRNGERQRDEKKGEIERRTKLREKEGREPLFSRIVW
jgi:hypothetical protein